MNTCIYLLAAAMACFALGDARMIKARSAYDYKPPLAEDLANYINKIARSMTGSSCDISVANLPDKLLNGDVYLIQFKIECSCLDEMIYEIKVEVDCDRFVTHNIVYLNPMAHVPAKGY